jgi:hypothetical protein
VYFEGLRNLVVAVRTNLMRRRAAPASQQATTWAIVASNSGARDDIVLHTDSITLESRSCSANLQPSRADGIDNRSQSFISPLSTVLTHSVLLSTYAALVGHDCTLCN